MPATRTSSLCKTLVAAGAIAALGAGATGVAEAKSPVKTAKFRATLSGSQVTTWEYHSVRDENPCTANIDAFGDQTIRFGSKRRFGISFTRPPKNQPDLFGTEGRPAVSLNPLFLNVPAKAERNGDFNVEPGSTSQCQGPNGGGVDPDIDERRDCGARDGQFGTRLYFHDQSEDADLFVPFEPRIERNRLRLYGSSYEWKKADGSDTETTLDAVYERCPMELDQGPERNGHIYISPAKVSEKRLFNKRSKRIVVSGHHIVKHTGRSTGQTILAWNLRLTRVK